MLERAGIADIGRPAGRQVLRRPAAAAAVRDGAAARPGAADARRADHRHGRRGAARLLGRDPRRTPGAGRTVIFATHYLDEADAYADRIVLVRQGRIVADGTAAEIKNLAAGRTVRATLPGADQAALAALPGVDAVEVRGDTRAGARPATPTRSPGTC